MPQYITYRRVSVDERQSGSVSLDWQRDVINKWLAARGERSNLDLVDNGVSASIHIKDREAGAALYALRTGHEAVVVCAKLDRAFRSVEDMAVTLRNWEENNVKFVSVTEGFDATTTFGWFQLTIMTAFAELERRTIAERIKNAVKTRREAGTPYSSEPPYGWSVEGQSVDADGRKRGGTLVADDAEQSVIQNVRDWHRRGKSLRAIAELLNASNIPTRRGGPWMHTMVQKILQTVDERVPKKKKRTFTLDEPKRMPVMPYTEEELENR